MQRYLMPGDNSFAVHNMAHQRSPLPAVLARNLLLIACLGSILRWCCQHTASVSLFEADRLNLTRDIPAELCQSVTHRLGNGVGIARYGSS